MEIGRMTTELAKVLANGDIYEGVRMDEKITGKGIYKWANGKILMNTKFSILIN